MIIKSTPETGRMAWSSRFSMIASFVRCDTTHPPTPSLQRIEGEACNGAFAFSPLSLVREGMSRSDRGECYKFSISLCICNVTTGSGIVKNNREQVIVFCLKYGLDTIDTSKKQLDISA